MGVLPCVEGRITDVNQLQGRKVAILAADGVEKVELERPRAAVEGAGGQVQLLSLKTGEIQAREHDLEPTGTFPVDRAVADDSVDEFDALALSGGTVNPDKLRLDESAVAFVRDFVRSTSRIHYLECRQRAPRIRHHCPRDCQTRTTSSLEG